MRFASQHEVGVASESMMLSCERTPLMDSSRPSTLLRMSELRGLRGGDGGERGVGGEGGGGGRSSILVWVRLLVADASAGDASFLLSGQRIIDDDGRSLLAFLKEDMGDEGELDGVIDGECLVETSSFRNDGDFDSGDAITDLNDGVGETLTIRIALSASATR